MNTSLSHTSQKKISSVLKWGAMIDRWKTGKLIFGITIMSFLTTGQLKVTFG